MLERAFERRPWLLPVVLAVLTILFFRAVILPPAQGAALNGRDFQTLFYPLETYIQNTLKAGDLPLWNPHQFIGHPIIGNPHAALFYPVTWLMWLTNVVRVMNLSMVFHAWLGAWGMAVLLRRFGASYMGSLLAGVIYGMSGWAQARFYAGHYNLFVVFAWLPWMVVTYQAALTRGTWRSLLPAMAVTAMALLAGYPPLVLYGGLLLVALWVYHVGLTADLEDLTALFRAAWYAGWRLLAIVVGGLILAAALVLPVVELTAVSSRNNSGDLSFANSFVLPPAQYLGLALPGFFGNPLTTPYHYWGGDFFEESLAYAGLLPLLAIPLIFRWQNKIKHHWYFLGLIALGVLMSIGLDGALMPLLWRWIPGFTSFRTPARALYFVMFGAAGLTALLVTALQSSTPEERREALRPALRLWLPITITIAFVGAIFFSGWYASASHVEPMPLRAFIISGGLAIAGMILLAIWFVLWLWTHEDRKALQWALLLTCALVTLDAWHTGYPIIEVTPLTEDPLWAGAQINVPTGADARVIPADLGFENLASITGHLSLDGYDPLPVEAYRRLHESLDRADPTNPVNTLLGVKYFMTTKPYDKPNFKLIGITNGDIYYQREDAFPRAWVAKSVTVEPNDDVVIQQIGSGKQDMKAMVYVDRQVNCPALGDTAGGEATISAYHTNDVTIQTSGNGGLLTLSDQYYPGWQATVDDQTADIIRGDTVFRSVCVPAGDHTVRFEFHPKSLYIGMIVSGIGWLVWLALCLTGLLRRRSSALHPASNSDLLSQ